MCRKGTIYASHRLNFLPLPLLALHDSRDGMSNNNTSPLDVPFREAAGHAYLQSWLRFPFLQEVFGCRADRERNCFESSDEYAVC